MEPEHFIGKIAQKVIINKDDKILLVRDARSPQGPWDIPGGRLNKGELPEEGLKREIREELGVEVILSEIIHVGTFAHTSEGDHLLIVYTAVLRNPDKTFKLQKEEILEVRWIGKEELTNQSIWEDLMEPLELSFNLSDK